MGRLARFIRFYTEEDDGNGGEKGVLKTVTGALLHIVDALAKPAKKFVATLEPIQDLHGQDAPYPSGGGKNKFICYDNLTITPNGVTCTFNGHSVTLVGTATATISLNITFGQSTNVGAELESGATYTWSAKTEGTIPNTINIYGGHYGTSTSQTSAFNPSGSASKAIPSEGTYYDRVWIGLHEGEVFNGTLYIQTEKGSSKTDFAPYSNICPITGRTGANVVRTGKNLLNPNVERSTTKTSSLSVVFNEYIQNGVYGLGYYNGTYVNANINFWITFTPCVAGETYTIYNSQDTFGTVCFLDASGNVVSTSNTWVRTYTHTAESNEKYIMASFKTADIDYVQLELGSTATTYEEYKGTTYSVTFPNEAGTVYGCTLTYANGEWKLRVDTIKGTMTVSADTGWTDATITKSKYILNLFDKNVVGKLAGNNNGKYLCNVAKYNYNSSDTVHWYATSDSTKDIRLHIPIDMSGSFTLECSAELVSPIEYTLSESQALTLLSGINNVWCENSDSLELTYYATAEETTP